MLLILDKIIKLVHNISTMRKHVLFTLPKDNIMSLVEAYLDTRTLIDAGATISDSNDPHYRILTFSDIKLKDYQSGTITLHLKDLQDEVNKVLLPFVTGYRFTENFSHNLEPKRKRGYYRLGTAGGDLETMWSGESHKYHVEIRANNIADLRDLYYLIKDGDIYPKIDYERKQVPPPYLHLGDLVREMGSVIYRDLREQLSRIRERVLGAY
jgi:hypothetical protein